jgi:hypothetical protein
MPQIYTKAEVDDLLKDLREVILKNEALKGVEFKTEANTITSNYNELYSLFNDLKNRMDFKEAKEKEQNKGAKSPYAR